MTQVQVDEETIRCRRRMALPSRTFCTVADIQRSLRFYGTVFGSRILSRATARARRVTSRSRTRGSLSTSGAVRHTTIGNAQRPRRPRSVSSFMNIRVADIRACYELWRSRGAEFITEPKEKYGETRCYIRDPDGYIIEVGQSKPGVAYG